VFIELRNITKKFGSTLAADNVSLGIEKGEFLTLLGPSGCGKTTTLRIVAGFVRSDSGSVYVGDERVDQKKPYERNMGMVFQNYALFPHMNVYENTSFGLKMRRADKDEIKPRVEKALELVRMSGFEERYPKQLSGGQQQRIALARSIVIEPLVLLLDEPLSNLDFKLRQQMRIELKRIHKELGITSIYVTHDQGEALAMSDRVAIMNRGRLVQVGTPSDLYEHPKSKFVADFLGEINFFDGKILEISESKVTVLAEDGLHLCVGPLANHIKENKEVSICVRPEKIVIEKRRTQEKNMFQGRIEDCIYTGSVAKYYVRLTGDRLILVNKPILDYAVLYGVGDDVFVGWSPESCTILEKGEEDLIA